MILQGWWQTNVTLTQTFPFRLSVVPAGATRSVPLRRGRCWQMHLRTTSAAGTRPAADAAAAAAATTAPLLLRRQLPSALLLLSLLLVVMGVNWTLLLLSCLILSWGLRS